jgi:hypothetical protein
VQVALDTVAFGVLDARETGAGGGQVARLPADDLQLVGQLRGEVEVAYGRRGLPGEVPQQRVVLGQQRVVRAGTASAVQLCRSAGIGTGMVSAVAPAPTPPSQVYGGTVPMPRVEGRSAAQNMKPSMPAVVPAPLGTTVCT